MKTCILVNDKDEIIGYKDRAKLEAGDIIRISSVWIENSKGEVLISQRSFAKNIDPGLWAGAAAGTLEKDETYEENSYIEAEEELGVTGVTLTPYKKVLWHRPDGTGRYTQIFTLTLDWPIERFVIQKEEVETVRWINKKELAQWLAEKPEDFVPTSIHWRELYNF